MRQRKKYHTSLKTVYSLGLETLILPPEFTNTIPASTIHGWRHDFNIKKQYGQEFAKQIDENLSDASSFLELSSDFDRKIIFSLLSVKRFLIHQLSKNGFQKLLRNNKEKTIQFIEWIDNKTDIGKSKISEYVGIGRKTISHWKRQIEYTCHTSTLKKCLIKNPIQATKHEINVMKKLLTDPDKAHWGIPSIQGFAIKNKLCVFSISSWYNYNRIFKFRTSINRFKKPVYKPLRASCVNEIWHADITVFKTLDGIKNYIYTVKDNFSRKTLAWIITKSVSAKSRMQTIQMAIEIAFPENAGAVRLITDGGPENDNQTIKNFIVDAAVHINHQIALKDIVQSNSMAEATYRCMKSHFLYGKQINDTNELEKYVAFYLHDHDFVRPHSAHKVYTPDEVYNDCDPRSVALKPLYRQAAIERIESNKISGCGIC
ncbi:DDE-type integrase/transposase/recombinase [Crocinitomix catalasitica]|uniref:DDE-type integrase/transposase/recombinase n=1 Tax=Crocinitomix catalasitica TaxID=184607 RepID=UPI00048941C0|nr:DDE-type integrase/transposase/recombinase [Crocinitomix catalasitica]